MWRIDPRALPRIRSYEKALAHFEAAPKVDSFGYNARPLCRKRDSSKLIIKRADSVALRYHHTDVVIYFVGGEIKVTPYDSSNTAIFAHELLPMGISTKIHKGVMYVGDVDGDYRPRNGALDFTYDGNNWRVVPEMVKAFNTYKLDIKRAAQIRKILKPFFEWREAAVRVGARFRSEGNGTCPLVMPFLREGHIPEHQYALLAPHWLHMPDTYILGGAVTKVPLPLGALPRETPYDNSSAWAYV